MSGKNILIYVTSAVAVFVLIFIEFFHPISAFKQDLGRHVLLGKIILTTHTVPHVNLFSYTYPNFPFINTHWLSEVAFYLFVQTAGLPGLLFVMAFIAALSVTILVLFSLKHMHTDKYVILFPIVLLYSGILFERTDLRPEIFSFLFMSMFLVLLWKNRAKTTFLLFVLPLIELLWVNIHIYFIIGPVLIGLFLLEKIIQLVWPAIGKANSAKQGWQLTNTDTKYIVTLLIVLILTCAATLLNPNGLTASLYPFVFSQNYGYQIEENQSVFRLLNTGLPITTILFFLTTMLILGILLLLYRKKSRPVDWLLYGTFSFLGFSAIRNFPLFVFATLPTFIFLAPAIPQKIQKVFLGASCLFAFLMLYLFITTNQLGYGINLGAEKGADFYLANHIQGPLFNNFDIGSYLDYRLYPQQVFVDSRPEAYPASFFQKTYIPMQENPKIFEQIDKQYHFQSIFFSYTDQTPWAQQFIVAIMKNQNWSLIYLDGFSAIWVKNDSQNQDFIHRFAITPQNFSLATINSTNTKDYLALAYFFQANNWQQLFISAMQKIVSIDPANCIALSALSQNANTSLFYSQSYLTHCQ